MTTDGLSLDISCSGEGDSWGGGGVAAFVPYLLLVGA